MKTRKKKLSKEGEKRRKKRTATNEEKYEMCGFPSPKWAVCILILDFNANGPTGKCIQQNTAAIIMVYDQNQIDGMKKNKEGNRNFPKQLRA